MAYPQQMLSSWQHGRRMDEGAGWLAGFAFALRATSGGQATQHGNDLVLVRRGT